MSRVEEIEQAVKNLPPPELAKFRRWFATYDGKLWDAQIKADAESGKLDTLAREARAAYDRGEAKEI